MERGALGGSGVRRVVIAATVLLAVAGGVLAVAARGPATRGRSAVAPLSVLRGEVRAPEGVRIRVQVLNATRTRGLARRATRYLRDRGFDVVEVGTSAEQRQTTLVLDRSGRPEWSALVGKLFDAPVEARPDTSRYLDVTVLLGASWRPPAEAFDP